MTTQHHTVDVRVGDWEHECCGPTLTLGDHVDWTVYAREGELYETHHDLEDLEGLETSPIAGELTAIIALAPDGEIHPIARIPSGRALRGFDKEDPGEIHDTETGASVERPEWFIVTVTAATPPAGRQQSD